jgi:hypothetical protein
LPCHPSRAEPRRDLRCLATTTSIVADLSSGQCLWFSFLPTSVQTVASTFVASWAEDAFLRFGGYASGSAEPMNIQSHAAKRQLGI